MVGLRPQKPKPDVGRALENQRVETGKECAGFRIVLTVFRRKLLDARDNAPFSLKALSDHITRGLGFDNDEDPRLTWEYHYVVSEHARGTHVLIIPL